MSGQQPVDWESGEPGAMFIQWKGTDICADVLCPACGADGHLCGMFAYHLRCLSCGVLIKMGQSVVLTVVEDPAEVAAVSPATTMPFGGPEGDVTPT